MEQINAARLLDWYSTNARDLPWRRNINPYKIWVSEIMLQQTRVDTVIPYYQKWMEQFPTVVDLSQADEQEVLAIWEGLGYYARARNLHRASKIIIKKHGGAIPGDLYLLQELPGIGPYTAGAIVSIAFGEKAPAVDANIRRVVIRLFAIRLSAQSPDALKWINNLVLDGMPSGKTGDFIQALMDLGALICVPRQPDCDSCPLRSQCKSFQAGIQDVLPVKPARKKIPHYDVTAAVIQQQDKVLITQRPPGGLLAGLWEFPGGKQENGEGLQTCLERELLEEMGVVSRIGEDFGIYKHAYTHFRVTLHVFLCDVIHGQPTPLHATGLRWVHIRDLPVYPMGKLDRLISNDLQSKI